MKSRNQTIHQAPIGILLTMGAQIISANGGLRSFVTHFTNCCRDENSGLWLQKSRACPTQDIAQVYLILCNRIWARVYFGGYSKEPTTVWMLDGTERTFPYPHMILSGPIEMAPRKMPMRGFQGFRYVHESLW
ncbi:MAG TPA: hypothetical protein VGN00_14195 [Puia sp.]|jgi:hypothetical protein